MSKRLITVNNVSEFVADNSLFLEKGMILTPAAADFARNRGIQIIHHNQPEAESALPTRIIRLLKAEFGITNPEKMAAVKTAVLRHLS